MSNLLWIGLGVAGGAWGLRKLLSAAPLGGGKSTMTTVTKKIDMLTTVLGRTTYLHAPVGARRLLVYFHGFGGNVATLGPKLAAALGDAPVALVMPQLGPKSEPGDLDFLMVDYVKAARDAVGLPSSPLDGVSHSGGYRALAELLRSTRVNGVALLDSLYGDYNTFHDAKVDCLIDIYGPTTTLLSHKLWLETSPGRFQVLPTITPHDEIPEKYLGQVARALPTCAKVIVS